MKTQPRVAALSAPANEDLNRVQNIVVDVVAGLSIIGSVWIIFSFALFKKLRTFRHQLILGLSISDLFMCINFFTSATADLAGRELFAIETAHFCSVNGFTTQLFIAQTDYWVFIIAVCTYLALESFEDQARWIREHSIVLWILAWGISIFTASIGLGLVGYGDIGAWCWFTNDRINLYVNYIPRWLMIFVMLVIYWRLYKLIFSAHTRFLIFKKESKSIFTATIESSASHAHLSGRHNSDVEGRASVVDSHDNGLETIESRQPTLSSGWIDDIETQGSRAQVPKPALKKMAYQMLTYPTAYMVIWSIPTAIRIYQATTNTRAGFAISTVDKAFVVSQGVVNAIIYGVNEASLYTWCDHFRQKRQELPPMPLTRETNSIQVEISRTVTVEPANQSKPTASEWSITSG